MSKDAKDGTKNGSWKFLQMFGDLSTVDKINEEDIITTIRYDKTGKFLAIGDRAGRLILFESVFDKKSCYPSFQYLTEFQSHIREFDYLKSIDVEEKINQICWLQPSGNNQYIASTNDKTIKIWKIGSKDLKKAKTTQQALKPFQVPEMEVVETDFLSTLMHSYPNLHQYLINSISTSQSEEILLSSDDLRIYIWSLQREKDAYNVIDLKPENLEDVSEVITCSKFHPIQDNQFFYCTSKGVTNVCDLRKQGVFNQGQIVLQEQLDPNQKNFFTDIIASISDACYSSNGRFIFTRDLLTAKVWDIRMPQKAMQVINIFEPLKSKLCELYENENIFDKFDIHSSPCGNLMVTGNFNNNFHILDKSGTNNQMFELNQKKKTIVKQIPNKYFEQLPANYNFNLKTLRSSFHPNLNMTAVTCLNVICFYGMS